MKYQGVELTMAEVMQLENSAADTALQIHYHTLHPNALNSLLTFIANCRYRTLSIYFEELDPTVAEQLFQTAKSNTVVQELELDLGEQILAFVSCHSLDDEKAQDIADFFISGIYRKVHTLSIDYPSMTLTQAKIIGRALENSHILKNIMLKNWLITHRNLDSETQDYLREQTQGLVTAGIEITLEQKLPTAPLEESVINVNKESEELVQGLPTAPLEESVTEDYSGIVATLVRRTPTPPEENINILSDEPVTISAVQSQEAGCFDFSLCLESLLTWLWNRPEAIEPIQAESPYARSYHHKRR